MMFATLHLTLLADGDRPANLSIGESREALLRLGRPITIGGTPAADIHIVAPSVGRRVVEVVLQSDDVWVLDLGSGGGSRLDSEGQITDRPRCRLPSDSTLWIGRVAFRVEIRTPS